jgi:methyl coenzyme M reductase alpha subunit
MILIDTSGYTITEYDNNKYISDSIDFENNYKSVVIEVTDIITTELTFLIYKSYDEFKQMIEDNNLEWNSINTIITEDRYILYFISENLLI